MNTTSQNWAYGATPLNFETRSPILLCACGRKYIPTAASKDQCLICNPVRKEPVVYRLKTYKRRPTYSEILATSREAVKRWRKQHPDKVNEYKRRHKQKHPESVKAWNRRYWLKNREAINARARLRYQAKISQATKYPS